MQFLYCFHAHGKCMHDKKAEIYSFTKRLSDESSKLYDANKNIKTVIHNMLIIIPLNDVLGCRFLFNIRMDFTFFDLRDRFSLLMLHSYN